MWPQLRGFTLSHKWRLQQQLSLQPPDAQLGLDLRTTVQLAAQWYASLPSTAAADLSACMTSEQHVWTAQNSGTKQSVSIWTCWNAYFWQQSAAAGYVARTETCNYNANTTCLDSAID